MAIDKYIELPSSGVLTEKSAIVTSDGAGSAGRILALDSSVWDQIRSRLSALRI